MSHCSIIFRLFASTHWYVAFTTHIIFSVTSITLYIWKYTSASASHQSRSSCYTTHISFIFYVAVNSLVNGALSFAFEVRERSSTSTEARLEESLDLYKRLLNSAPCPVLLAANSEVRLWNAALLKLLGESEAVGKVSASALREVRQRNGEKTFEEIVVGGEEVETGVACNQFVLSSRGVRARLVIKSVRIPCKDRTVILYIIEDHTVSEELEKARMEEKCFSILLSTASHDFRTPLNGLHGLLELIQPQIQDSPCFKDFDLAHQCIHRMLAYLQGLALLRSIVGRNLQVKNEAADVRKVVGSTLVMMEYTVREKRLRVSLDVRDVPSMLVMDREKYQLILLNVVENAVKYSFRGEILITVVYDSVNEMLTTRVKDEGVGIPREKLKNIFKLFHKYYDQDYLNPQGMGVGAFLVKELSVKLGGDAHFTSEEGVGTLAEFCIRAERWDKSTTDTERAEGDCVDEMAELKGRTEVLAAKDTFMQARLKKRKAKCKCPKVLIVDDEPLNIYVLQSYLRTKGVGSDIAINGQEALEAIEKKNCENCGAKYDVVFMDINMPVLGGLEATREIRRLVLSGKIPNTHVIAVTAAAHLEDPAVSSRYLAMGFSDIRTVAA